MIELVIVVVIIAIIGAIAIPRMSRGAAGAGDSALTQDLALMRSAVELYAAEHGGAYPTDNTTISDQLTKFTDVNGNTNGSKVAPFIYGPYLKQVPAAPVGKAKGYTGFVAAYTAPSATAPNGWIYSQSNGLPNLTLNTDGTESDVKGTAYVSY